MKRYFNTPVAIDGTKRWAMLGATKGRPRSLCPYGPRVTTCRWFVSGRQWNTNKTAKYPAPLRCYWQNLTLSQIYGLLGGSSAVRDSKRKEVPPFLFHAEGADGHGWGGLPGPAASASPARTLRASCAVTGEGLAAPQPTSARQPHSHHLCPWRSSLVEF